MPVLETNSEQAGLLLDVMPQEETTSASIRTQVIIAEYQGTQLAFPSAWVDEVMLFPRQQLYHLPFYPQPLLGLIPHHGQLVPLVEYGEATTQRSNRVNAQENIRAMRLSPKVGDLKGVAIIVDKIIGTMGTEEFDEQTTVQLFSPEDLSLDTFEPTRWA